MIDAVPDQPKVVIVEDATDHSPQIFLGFTAYGDDASLKTFQSQAKKLRIPAEPCPEDAEKRFIMVAFPPSGRQNVYMDFYRQALRGDFGKLSLELALLAVAKAQNGGSLDDAYASSPEAIIMPSDAK